MKKPAVILFLFLLALAVGGCGSKSSAPSADDFITVGNKLYAEGKRKEAIDAYTKAIEIDPNNVRAYEKRALAKGASKDSSKKFIVADYEDCSKLIELDPQNPRWYVWRAEEVIESFDFSYSDEKKSIEDALKDCNRAILLDQPYWLAYYVRAKCYDRAMLFNLVQKNKERIELFLRLAIDDCNRALEIQPNSMLTYGFRAGLHARNDDYEKEIDDYTKAIEISRDKHYRDIVAIEECKDIKRLDSIVTAYVRARGTSYAVHGNREKAVADAKNSDDLVRFGDQLVNKYSKSKNYPEAIFYYTKAIELSSGETKEIYIKRGDAYESLGDYANAIADYTKAAGEGEISADVYHKCGNIYLKLEDWVKAIDNYNHAIEKGDNAYFHRGYAYGMLKDYAHAIENYTKAIEQEESSSAYNNRGNCYDGQEKYDNALADYSKAIEISTKNSSYYRSRNRIKEANENDHDAAMYYRNRGLLHQKLGHTAEAEADLAKAQELEAK